MLVKVYYGTRAQRVFEKGPLCCDRVVEHVDTQVWGLTATDYYQCDKCKNWWAVGWVVQTQSVFRVEVETDE